MLVFFVVLAFCVFFPLLWTLIIFIVSQTSGWARLAKYYRTDLPTPAHANSMMSGIIGSARYNGVLTVGMTEEGIYLKTFVLFSMFHPPLFISWQDIEISKGKYFFWDMQVLRVGKSKNLGVIRLYASQFPQLRA